MAAALPGLGRIPHELARLLAVSVAGQWRVSSGSGSGGTISAVN